MKNKEYQKKYDISEAQFSGEEKIIGSLDLRGLTSIPTGFNPTVGGSLYLRGLTSIPTGFNPTVGGYLYWKNNSKYIGTRDIPRPRINKNFFWDKNGKRYAMIDGIFCEILSEKKQTIQENEVTVFNAQKINKSDTFYIVKSEEYCAHGQDLKKAFEDLTFKIASEKLKNEPIEADTMITVNHYRLITGACEFGVKNWMRENNITSEEIKAEDLLKILKKTNAYGLESFRKLVRF